jgi:hypothetical protein
MILLIAEELKRSSRSISTNYPLNGFRSDHVPKDKTQGERTEIQGRYQSWPASCLHVGPKSRR